jgi:hypothetical protein
LLYESIKTNEIDNRLNGSNRRNDLRRNKMKKAIRNAMAILAGVSIIFAAAGNAVADEVANIGGVQISASDFAGVKARVAGEPSGNRIYADKSDAVSVGPVQVAKADFNGVRSLVAGDASIADAAVYARAPEMVNLGSVAIDKAEFDAVRSMVENGSMARLANHIQGAGAALN